MGSSEGGVPEADDLVRRAQAGDADAFDQLVRVFGKPMYNLAYRMTGNAADASDLSQEIFVKLHRSLGKFRWRSKFSTWLYALGSNTCRSGLRRLRRISSAEVVRLDRESEQDDRPGRIELADPSASPGRQAELADVRAHVEGAIAELPEAFRMVIVLRDLQGLEYEEIAQSLKCSVGTVKSRLARARGRVKDALTRKGVVCAATS